METPFDQLPSGWEIARYFVRRCANQQQTHEGFDLWRDGDEYSYVWKLVEIDLDYNHSWLLEVRTSTNGDEETRDLLIVRSYDGEITYLWQNAPIAFSATPEAHEAYLRKGMEWFLKFGTPL